MKKKPGGDELAEVHERSAARRQQRQAITDVPTFLAKAFPCPKCGVKSHQAWFTVVGSGVTDGGPLYGPPPQLNVPGVYFCSCQACLGFCIWVDEKIAHPSVSTAPMPSPDMPDDVKADYLEARDVFDKSARAAGGLLRISFEKLLPHLGVTKKTPNEAIGELVKKGLVLGTQQQALDAMRIFSNQTAHDGFVKLEDQPETVGFLFRLLNHIVGHFITHPKEVAALYSTIPPDKLAGIQKRDAKK